MSGGGSAGHVAAHDHAWEPAGHRVGLAGQGESGRLGPIHLAVFGPAAGQGADTETTPDRATLRGAGATIAAEVLAGLDAGNR